MHPKNSELRDWLNSIGINLCDAVNDDEIVAQTAVEFCRQLKLDPEQLVQDGGSQSTQSTFFEPQTRSFLAMLRAFHVVLNREAGDHDVEQQS